MCCGCLEEDIDNTGPEDDGAVAIGAGNRVFGAGAKGGLEIGVNVLCVGGGGLEAGVDDADEGGVEAGVANAGGEGLGTGFASESIDDLGGAGVDTCTIFLLGYV